MKDYTKYKFNVKRSNLSKEDFCIESILYSPNLELPTEFNWKPELLKVRDQGEQGSCSAMTAATIKEVQESVEVGFDGYFSPQFIYNLRSNKNSEGMTPKNTMEILKNYGVIQEVKYPYNTTQKITRALLNLARPFRIKDAGTIGTIFTAKASLLINGPLYVALPVYDPNMEKFWRQSSKEQQLMGGHAVCFIGWDETGFIGRNSWGEQWGNGGYFHFPYEDWGLQWEIWGLVDATTNLDSLCYKADRYIRRKKQSFLEKVCKILK